MRATTGSVLGAESSSHAARHTSSAERAGKVEAAAFEFLSLPELDSRLASRRTAPLRGKQ